MRRIIGGLIVFLSLTSLVFAQYGAGKETSERVTLKGTIIDNACAGGHKDNLASFIKTHTKECAIAPGCIDSGYSIYSYGKLYKFDKASSAKVGDFLKKAFNKLDVTVVAKKVGDELSLVSIKNRGEY